METVTAGGGALSVGARQKMRLAFDHLAIIVSLSACFRSSLYVVHKRIKLNSFVLCVFLFCSVRNRLIQRAPKSKGISKDQGERLSDWD